MDRQMYKKNREVSFAEAEKLLLLGHHGTLAVNGDGGYPYNVPINYIYLNKAIYIHSAQYGYKMEALRKDNKACFSAIIRSKIIPSKFTAKFESIVAFGTIDFIENVEEKQLVLERFIDQFSPDFKVSGMKFVEKALEKTAILKLNIENMKGKTYRGDSW